MLPQKRQVSGRKWDKIVLGGGKGSLMGILITALRRCGRMSLHCDSQVIKPLLS